MRFSKYLILFFIAFFARIFLLFVSNDRCSMCMDEIEYHNIAVNLVLKKSYSLEPIEKGPTYYREPALPVFFAALLYTSTSQW